MAAKTKWYSWQGVTGSVDVRQLVSNKARHDDSTHANDEQLRKTTL